jgi:hypothetical protein
LTRYRTEILIPPDGYVCLQLPPGLPAGRATVSVEFRDEPAEATPQNDDPDREDIEWWEEFDEARD